MTMLMTSTPNGAKNKSEAVGADGRGEAVCACLRVAVPAQFEPMCACMLH